MRKILTAALATLVVGSSLVSPTAASAANGRGQVIYPRMGGMHGFRGAGAGAWNHGARFGNWNRGYAGNRFYPGYYGYHQHNGYRGYAYGYPGRSYGGYYGYDDGYDGGAAIAGGVLGLAAGAILSGALSHHSGGAIGWCQAHYRSYDVGSRSFMGNDGMRHPCPAR